MKIYKLWEFHIPSNVFDFNNKLSTNGINVKIKNNYVVLSSEDKKEISLNSASTKVRYQIDGILFTSSMKDAGNYKITYFKQLGGDANYVLHKGNFNKDSIIDALFGLNISDSDDNTIELSFKKGDDNVVFEVSSPVNVQIQINSNGEAFINGSSVAGTLNYSNGTLTIKASSDNNNIYQKSSSLPDSVSLVDSTASEYYIEYDPDNATLIKKTIEFDGYLIDKYSSVLNKVKNMAVAANMLSIYLTDEDRYIDRNEFSFVTYSDSKITSTQISRVISALIDTENKVPMYNYGFFKTSDRVFPYYAYVGSSFAYIKYGKAKAGGDSCQYSSETGVELALYFKVQRNKGVTIRSDKTAKTELTLSDAAFGNELLKKLRKGFGVFNDDLFNLKRYSDDGSHIKIQYNYQNSKNYFQADIYDETMRYKIVETQKVNGNEDQKTYYYRFYKSNPEMELKGTKAKINMLKKVNSDFISDSEQGSNYLSTVTIPPFSVLELSLIHI